MNVIGFTNVPSSAIASGVFVEQANVRGSLGGLKIPEKIALFGQYNSGKSVVNYTPRLLASADEAASLYGVGSMLHLMARKAFAAAGSVPIYACPIPDSVSGTAAQGSITVSGNASSSGTLALFIAGQKVPVPVTLGSNAATVAQAIASALAAAVNLPVSGSPSGAVINLTAKWKGTTGNDIGIKLDLDDGDSLLEPTGITLTISQLAGGATNPDPSNAFEALGATFFTFIAYPFADSANLTILDNYFNARIAPGVKKPIVAMIGDVTLRAVYNAMITLRNGPGETFVNVEASPSLPCEIAASAVGACANSAQANPARPWKTLLLPGIRAGTLPAWTWAMHDATQGLGGGTTDPNLDGTVKIHDLVTTYQTNALGAADDSFRYPETIANMQGKIYSLDNLFSGTPFDRAIVVDDEATTGLEYAISPKRVKGFLIRLLDELWLPNAWSKNRAAILASIVAEIDSGNAGRINVRFTDVMSAGLRIMAIEYQWSFSAGA
jgi:phage tail sheath gpL-like